MSDIDPDVRRRRLEFGELMQRISMGFINLSVDEIGPGIESALGELGRLLGVDRALIIVVSELLHRSADAPPGPNEVMTMAHEWRADGVVPSLDDRGRLKMHPEGPDETRRANEWFREVIRTAATVRCDSLDDLPESLGFLRRRWARQSVKSRMGLPMRIEGVCVGILGVDCVRQERRWDDETEERVRAAAPIFAHAVLRKQNAEAIREAHANLERKVEERTRELREKQAQLVQSEKLASLGRLVAGIAHEVNNPLGAIKSNHDTTQRALRKLDEMLRERRATGEGDAKQRREKLLEGAIALAPCTREAIDRIETLVTSLRAFARLDRAEIDRFDLRAGLSSTLAMLRHELEARVRVHTHYADIPAVECVPSQINQVFMSLLLNAREAIEDEGEIRLSAEAEGDCVRLEFRDTGRGIAPRDLPRVFDPGFTTKGVGVGTGLGLTIVHRIVEEHGGRVSIDSTPGRGTTVTLWLPIDAPASGRSSGRRAAAAREAGPETHLRGGAL